MNCLCDFKFGEETYRFCYSRNKDGNFTHNNSCTVTEPLGHDMVITLNNTHKYIDLTVEDLAKCSSITRDIINANHEAIDDTESAPNDNNEHKFKTYIKHLEGDIDMYMNILRMLVIIHSSCDHAGDLKHALSKDIKNCLREYTIDALRLADFLGINESVNLLLDLCETDTLCDLKIMNHDIKYWETIKYWARGYQLDFDGIIHEIHDYGILKRAIEKGMRVLEIHDGKYITDDILRLCNHIEILNIDSNPYATRLESFASTLVELHCCNSSGVRQNQLDLCTKLKRLYIDNNPYITRCRSFDLVVLCARGNCSIGDETIARLTKLEELNVIDNMLISEVPESVTRLSFGMLTAINTTDFSRFEYLEIKRYPTTGIILGPKLKTLIHNSDNADGSGNMSPDIRQAINLEKLITPNRSYLDLSFCTKLKHLRAASVSLRTLNCANTLEILKVQELAEPVKSNSFSRFKKLHTLHITVMPCDITLPPDSAVKNLECIKFKGRLPELDHLCISSICDDSNWDRSLIKTFSTVDPTTNLANYPSLTEYTIKSTLHDMPHVVYPDIKKLTIGLVDGFSKFGMFKNLTNLTIQRIGRNDNIRINCESLPMLRYLNVNMRVSLSGLRELSRLEELCVHTRSLTDLSNDYNIINPLLRVLDITMHVTLRVFTVHSKWLNSLQVISDNELKIAELLILGSPHVEKICMGECTRIVIIDHDHFLSLIEYEGYLPIDFEKSKRTIQEVAIYGSNPISMLDLETYPALRRLNDSVLTSTGEWQDMYHNE